MLNDRKGEGNSMKVYDTKPKTVSEKIWQKVNAMKRYKNFRKLTQRIQDTATNTAITVLHGQSEENGNIV